ncbi:MAG TPA: alpha/beta hydrolase [Exilispira sp.]|nr:alpha/beta hydrolase [Exilispira sp.]
MFFLYFLIIALILFILLILLSSLFFTFLLIPIKKFSKNFTIEDGIKKSEFTENELKEGKIDFSFISRFGYILKGQIFVRDLEKIVIFSHGVTWTLYGMYKYIIPFLNQDYTCVLIDSKGHGESTGGFPTYGYYEKYDLVDFYYFVMDFLKTKYFEKLQKTNDESSDKKNSDNKFDKNYKPIVGLFGESMGAAITLQALNLFNKGDISFCIVESPFSDLKKLCLIKLNESIKIKFLTNIIYQISRMMIKILAKFDIEKIKPIEIDDNIDVPILFFHGKDDRLVPYFMSDEIYERRKEKYYSEIYIIKGADHTKGFMMEKDFYIEKIFDFIKKVIDKNNIDKN